VLQFVAVRCMGGEFTCAENKALQWSKPQIRVAVNCRVLQGVTGCCRVLQGTAVCCSVLQGAAVRCSVLHGRNKYVY